MARFKIKKRNPPKKGFKFRGITSPKVCPLCLTEGQIKRLETLEWQCQACGNTWQKKRR